MKNVVFLGVEGAGKTVLTYALVNAFRAHANDGWYLRPDTRESFRFLSQFPEDLTFENLPHQTTALKHLAWSVQLNERTQRMLDVLDYPGEIYRLAFLNAKDDTDPVSFAQRVDANREDIDALFAHLADAGQVFVLFNLSDAEEIEKNSANLDAVWITNACLDYLHRLPQKPVITLLLTQIDRYVDLSKEETDLTGLVARHLPLVHHNFPDLDVIGVSVLGMPGRATFGVDGILLRCLYECEAVSSVVNELKKQSQSIDETLKGRTKGLSRDYSSCIPAMLSRCESLALKLPWFVSREQLHECGLHIDHNENREIGLLVNARRDLLESENQDSHMTAVESVRNLLRRSVPTTKAGTSLRADFLKELDAELLKCQRERDGMKEANGCFLVLMIAVVVIGLCILIFN